MHEIKNSDIYDNEDMTMLIVIKHYSCNVWACTYFAKSFSLFWNSPLGRLTKYTLSAISISSKRIHDWKVNKEIIRILISWITFVFFLDLRDI